MSFASALRSLSPIGSLEGKAVLGLDTIPGSRDSAPEVFGATFSSTSGSRYSGTSARRQLESFGSGHNRAIDWVADAMSVIADTAASAEWHFEDAEGEEVPCTRKDAEKSQRLADPWLVQLLEEPNAWTTWEELVFLVWVDKYITGDAFIYKRGESPDGHPLELHRLPPHLVEIKPGQNGKLIDSYEYKVPGKPPIQIAPDKIIHWKSPNPHDAYRGAGIIAKGPRVYDLEVALNETRAAYMENGARLEGVLESGAAISDSLAQKLRRQFSGIYSGARNAFQVAVLGRGLVYKPIQSNAKDAELIQLTEQSRDRILAMFRVPRVMLGLAIETSSTTGPSEERRVFANSVMRPALNAFQTLMTKELTADFGLSFCIEYEYQMPIEDKFKLGTEMAVVPGVTVEEVRANFNLEPLTGKNAKYNDMVLNLPGENEDSSTVKDRAIGSEGGRPPDPTNTASFDDAANPDAAVGT